MPLYRCAILEGATRIEQRAQIAKEIVRIHCDVTAAPPSFVHAFFLETPAAELPAGKSAFVFGSIRWGRSDEQKARLVGDDYRGRRGPRPRDRGGRRRHRRRALQMDHGGG